MLKTDSKTYLVLGMVLIFGITFGYLLGSGAKNQAYQLGLEKGRKEIEEKYRKKIEEIFPPFPKPEEIFSVSGRIVDVKAKTLVLEETISSPSPFEEPEIRSWQVKITEETELVKRMEKSPEELAAERKTEEPAEFFKEVKIEFINLKIGDEVIAEAGENIKGRTEFEAQKIILIPRPGL